MSGAGYREHFVPAGGVYLTTVGYGTGALLGRGIRRVRNAHRLDELGIAQALWVFEAQGRLVNETLDRVYAGLRPRRSASTARPTIEEKSRSDPPAASRGREPEPGHPAGTAQLQPPRRTGKGTPARANRLKTGTFPPMSLPRCRLPATEHLCGLYGEQGMALRSGSAGRRRQLPGTTPSGRLSMCAQMSRGRVIHTRSRYEAMWLSACRRQRIR